MTTKFCVNCRHYNNYVDLRTVCLKTEDTDMVTGDKTYRTCLETRQCETLCGRDASWFEAKPK